MSRLHERDPQVFHQIRLDRWNSRSTKIAQHVEEADVKQDDDFPPTRPCLYRNQRQTSMNLLCQTYLWVFSVHLPHVFTGRNLGDSVVMSRRCFDMFVHVRQCQLRHEYQGRFGGFKYLVELTTSLLRISQNVALKGQPTGQSNI